MKRRLGEGTFLKKSFLPPDPHLPKTFIHSVIKSLGRGGGLGEGAPFYRKGALPQRRPLISPTS
jgi:hypothetical protein